MSNETNSPNGDSKKMRREIPVVETDENDEKKIPQLDLVCFYLGEDLDKNKISNSNRKRYEVQTQLDEHKSTEIKQPDDAKNIVLKEEDNKESKDTKTDREV